MHKKENWVATHGDGKTTLNLRILIIEMYY